MNYLDTRDLYKRQCELQSELDDLEMELEDAKERLEEAIAERDNNPILDEEGTPEQEEYEDAKESYEDAQEALQDWKDEYEEELKDLNDLEIEIGSEWMHGETLIPEDEFENYAREFAEDIHGEEVRNAAWPFDCIDWEQAADALRQDYSSVDFQGESYLFRS